MKSHPRQYGSLSPLARKSARAPDTGALAGVDGSQQILNINIPSATMKKKKGAKDAGNEDAGSATYLGSGSPQLSMSAKQFEPARRNTEAKRSHRARNLSSVKGQTEQRKPKVKNKLERTRAGQRESKTKETEPVKRSFDLKDYRLDTLGTRLRKFDQVEETIRRYHQPPELVEPPHETSIERYYRLYVNDGPDSIKDAPLPQYTEKFKAQLAMTANKRHTQESLEMKHVTKEGYQKAVNDINRLLSLQDTLSLAERSQDARAVLHTHMKGCDCPLHGNKMME